MTIKTSLTVEDYKKLLEAATNQRDRLILSFYYDTGVRCSELLRIKRGNIDLMKRTVLIPHLKRGVHKICPKCNKQGGARISFCSKCGTNLTKVEPVGIEERSRLIEISPDLTKQIGKFLEGDPEDPERPLIELSRQSVYFMIRQVAEKAGLGGKIMLNPETGRRHYVHIHNFRDSLASDWLEHFGDNLNAAKALQNKLGHKNFETTQRYNKLTQEVVDKYADEIRKKRQGK